MMKWPSKMSSTPLSVRNRLTNCSFSLPSSRFDDFDEAIDEAIEEDLQDSEGGGLSYKTCYNICLMYVL